MGLLDIKAVALFTMLSSYFDQVSALHHDGEAQSSCCGGWVVTNAYSIGVRLANGTHPVSLLTLMTSQDQEQLIISCSSRMA